MLAGLFRVVSTKFLKCFCDAFFSTSAARCLTATHCSRVGGLSGSSCRWASRRSTIAAWSSGSRVHGLGLALAPRGMCLALAPSTVSVNRVASSCAVVR